MADAFVYHFDGDCNNNCVVCTGRLRGASSLASLPGNAPVVIRGREPTLQPGFMDLLRSLGRVELHTNGRRFAYRSFVDDVGFALARVVVSVHGSKAAMHDDHTRVPGSYAQTIAGIENLVAAGVPVSLRLLVTVENLDDLGHLVDLAADLGCDEVRFLWLGPNAIGLSADLVGPSVAGAVRRAWRAGLAGRVAGLAACDLIGLLPWPGRSRLDDLFVSGAEPVTPRLLDPLCVGCALRQGCVGSEQPVLLSKDGLPAPGRFPAAGSRPPHAMVQRSDRSTLHREYRDGELRIVLRTTCSNVCSFCTTAVIHEDNECLWSVDDLFDVLAGLREEFVAVGGSGGHAVVDRPQVRFVAIEPAEHPDISVIVAAAARWSGRPVWMDTSGVRFADAAFADGIVRLGLAGVDIPLLGPNAAVHDAVAGRVGAFDETMVGVGHLHEAHLNKIVFHTVLVRDNAAFLLKIMERANQAGTFSHVSVAAPASWALERYERIAFFLPEAVEEWGRQVAHRDEATRRRLAHLLLAEVPPCLLDRFLHISVRDSDVGLALPEPVAILEERGALLKRRVCCPLAPTCRLAAFCAGLYPEYLAIYGVEGLVAVS